ncbi:glycoprotein-N-acetylgalactosamine 3-beta-galactosyltransferase 1-like [Antedon mediterranea]|uniref:glycoprotein-N-acetylgalactosamine 3-beta-galactosyltransferase 1-like n=1 Tax=Antedon mediterranea TaxID=105859 RepID=UPI003AF66871
MQKRGLFSLFIGLFVGCCSVVVYNRYVDIVNMMNHMPVMTIGSSSSHLSSKVTADTVDNIGYPSGSHESLPVEYSIDGKSYFFQASEQNEPEGTLLSELGAPKSNPALDSHFVNYLKRNDFDPRLNSTILNSKVRILCFTITPQNQLPTAQYQLKTWGKHCDKFVILTSGGKTGNDVEVISLPNGAQHSWNRLKSSLQWCLKQNLDNYDWIVKVEYDTFLILENLRYMLIMHSTSIKDYIGQVFAGKQGRASTIALSREGLTKLSPVIQLCEAEKDGQNDDEELQNCFNKVKVYPREDGRDYTGENRFQLLIPNHEVPVTSAKFVVWYWRFIKQPGQKLPDCCSDYAISYMYASRNNMYLLEYMIYHMRPYGIGYYNCPANKDIQLDSLFKGINAD